MKINCIEPKIIVHYQAISRIIRYKEFVINGRSTNLDETPLSDITVGKLLDGVNSSKYRKYMKRFYTDVSEYYEWINSSLNRIIENNYIFDRYTGESFPIFQMVPCGHCACCREKKFQEWTTRVTMESQLYDFPPLFFTLTYDTDRDVDGLLHRDDVQKFIKRFRQVVKRDGLSLPRPDLQLRIYGHAEYGRKHHRPHMHFLLWNYPVCGSKYHTMQYIKSCINVSWLYGDRPSVKSLDISYSRDAGKYVSRYLSKPSHSPKEKESPSFFIRPCRPALGKVYFNENLRDFHKANPYLLEFSFQDKHTGQTLKKPMFNYVKNQCFPTHNRLVRSEERKEFSRVVSALHDIADVPRVRIRKDHFSDLTDYNMLVQKYAMKARDCLRRLHRYSLFDIKVPLSFRLPSAGRAAYLKHLKVGELWRDIKPTLDKMLSLKDDYFDSLIASDSLNQLNQSYRLAEPINQLSNAGAYAKTLVRGHRHSDALELVSTCF